MTSRRFFHPDQLTAIREQCDWRKLLDDLGVRADARRCTATEFWGYSPFTPNEKTASFHMKDPGIWYDWSSHATAPGRDRPGGGVIELIQAVHATRGQIMKLNEAASWIVDQGYARLDEAPAPSPRKSDETEKMNAPIDIDLVPKLTELGTHPAFVERGISEETCRYLRCGYLAPPETGRGGPLAGRLAFQVGGLDKTGTKRVILSHVGRAVTPEQEERGKWLFYRGFNPSLELYNIDKLLLDAEAAKQAKETGTVVLTEGTFDVAKCVEAGIKNVVASFGARLYDRQAEKLNGALARLKAERVLIFYDRDAAGEKACVEALAMLQARDIPASVFDWNRSFDVGKRKDVPIPEEVCDPCEFTVAQLRWLRGQGVV